MNAYEKSIQLNLTGSDEDIVYILSTIGHSDITKASLGKWLRENLLLTWTGEQWIGSLQDAVNANQVPNQLVQGVNLLKSILVGVGGDGLAVTDPVWSPTIFGLLNGLTQLIGSETLVNNFYNLANGRPYIVTEETFSSQRDAYVLSEQKNALIDILISKKIQFDSNYNNVLLLINSGSVSSEEEIIAELQVA